MAIKLVKKKIEVAEPVAFAIPGGTLTATGATISLTVTPQLMASDLSEEIDEIGRLQHANVECQREIDDTIKAHCAAQLEAMEANSARIAEVNAKLKEALKEKYDGKDPDTIYKEFGLEYECEIGKKGNSREVDVPKALELMLNHIPQEKIWQLVNLPLKHVDAYLTPDDHEKCVTKHRTDRGIAVKKTLVPSTGVGKTLPGLKKSSA